MTKELTAAFDYSQVDGDTKGKLIRLAGQINKYSGAMVDSANELRQSVHEAHKLLSKARKGLFDEWVDRETDVGRSTAYNMLSVSAREANYPIFGQLPLSAGYLLAASGVPDGAIKEVEKAVEKGARPTVELIKSTLAKFREANDKPKGKGKTTALKPASSKPDAERPKPAPVVTPEEDEPEEELDFDAQVKQANGQIESFCRQLVSFYEANCPKLESINYQGRYDSALAHVRACCTSLRACKYHDKPCPKCGGDGCSSCSKESDFGGVTAITFRQLAG